MLKEQHFEKMMFYLMCDMNLLVYGVGTKRNVIQDFMLEYVQPDYPTLMVRGYHSGLNPRQILEEVNSYIQVTIDHKPYPTNNRKWPNMTE